MKNHILRVSRLWTIVKYCIKSVKKDYFDNTFIIYKNDPQKAWLSINKSLNNTKKIETIND